MAGNKPNATSASPRREGDRLDSWKAIAAYLNRTVRTVHRWETHEGLPVHRHHHKKSGSVYAYQSEIDAWWESAAPEAETRRNSSERLMLAVLPFERFGGGPDDEYLAAGFTEDLITDLARLDPARLGVIARTSAMAFKGTGQDVKRIGRKLGVGYVVEGSVRREGDRLRVTAQLISVQDQTHLWAERYDRAIGDVLRMQSDIARAIASEIHLQLSSDRDALLPVAPAVHPGAYQAYLKGRFFMYQMTGDAIRKAVEYFQEAIRLDPNYAAAYAGVAEACVWLPAFAGVLPRESFPRALDAAQKALKLDSGLSEAFASLGAYHTYFGWDWSEAEKALRQAGELNPSNIHARVILADLLSFVGRHDEAIAEGSRACEIDPLSLFVHSGFGFTLYLARKYDEALKQLERTLELDPNYLLTYLNLGLVLTAKGDYEKAVGVFRRARELAPHFPDALALLAYACGRSGRSGEALALLNELRALERQQFVPHFLYATVYVGLEDEERSLGALEASYDERTWLLGTVKSLPIFDPLWGTERFKHLVSRMKFPHTAP